MRGEVGPNKATVGACMATAICIGPVSFDTRRFTLLKIAASCFKVVFPHKATTAFFFISNTGLCYLRCRCFSLIFHHHLLRKVAKINQQLKRDSWWILCYQNIPINVKVYPSIMQNDRKNQLSVSDLSIIKPLS